MDAAGVSEMPCCSNVNVEDIVMPQVEDSEEEEDSEGEEEGETLVAAESEYTSL